MEVLPVAKDQYGNTSTSSRKRGVVGTLQITMLGIGTVIAGHNAFWNNGLQIGCYDFLACALCMGLGFFIAALCLSEMTSALPFSGGMYGFVRLTYGNHLGFLVGTSEILQNLVYTSYLLIWFSTLLSNVIFGTQVYSLLFAFLFFIFALPLHCIGGKIYWRFATTVCVLALVLLVMYIGTAASSANFNHFTSDHHHEISSLTPGERFSHALTSFPCTSWFFVGIEMIPLVTADASEPRKTVPRGIMISVCFMIIMSIALILCVSANSPSIHILAMENMPLKFGYMQHFHLNEVHAAALSIPALFISALNFIYIYGRQMKAMAESNLLPRCLTWTNGGHQSPYISNLIGSFVVMVFIAISYVTDYKFIRCMSNVSILISFFIYTFILLSYLRYKKFYQSRRKETQFICTSNRYLTYVGICIFCLAIVALVGFNGDGYIVCSFFVVFQILMTICYKGYVFQRQSFSEEEKNTLFAAYVMKANRLTKDRMFRRKQSQVGVLSSSGSVSSLKSLSDCKISVTDPVFDRNKSNRSLLSMSSNQSFRGEPRTIQGRARSLWFFRLDSFLGRSNNDVHKKAADMSIHTSKTHSIMSANTMSFCDRHLNIDSYDEDDMEYGRDVEEGTGRDRSTKNGVVMAFKELEASFRGGSHRIAGGGGSQNNSLRRGAGQQSESSSLRLFAGLMMKNNSVSPGQDLSASPSFRSLGGISSTSDHDDFARMIDNLGDKLSVIDLETGLIRESADSYELRKTGVNSDAEEEGSKEDVLSVAEESSMRPLGACSSTTSIAPPPPLDSSPIIDHNTNNLSFMQRSVVSNIMTMITTATTITTSSAEMKANTAVVVSPTFGSRRIRNDISAVNESSSIRVFSQNGSAANSMRRSNADSYRKT